DGGSDGGADAASGAGGDAGSDGGTGATGDAGGDAGGGGSEDGGGSCTKCTTYGAASASTNLGIAAVTELSGLAASHAHPGVFYAHNDSGDSARFFAFALDGAELGTFNVQGLAARDWEDVDIGPCPTGTCLFFADFGDNAVARTDCRIIRVAEPSVSVGSPVGTVSVTYDRFDFTYPDGSHNAETLLVHPRTGDLYVVTKQSGTSQVFRMPSPGAPGASQVLTAVGTLPLGGTTLATGGSIHPCGDRFLLRTYGTLLEYVATGPFETAFTVAPRSVPVAGEPQGEAVTYLADGRGYLTVSEGASPALNLASCQ
ncbi:MAG: hypothetical protein FJ104_07005, partial [Deltaproteobacteria bacterium]|nr:hypothetical protein [Deltaproteobacteria bacterium]